MTTDPKPNAIMGVSIYDDRSDGCVDRRVGVHFGRAGDPLCVTLDADEARAIAAMLIAAATASDIHNGRKP